MGPFLQVATITHCSRHNFTLILHKSNDNIRGQHRLQIFISCTKIPTWISRFFATSTGTFHENIPTLTTNVDNVQ